ncbi:MAG TPA: DUF4383 domain-containing protein [Solirubrobacteraceae bacterium]|nr:DUF4383 domain-containing protein [Solirubrobacteraceae bacterium]
MATSLAGKVGLAFGAFYVALGVVGFFVTGFGGALTGEQGHAILGVAINQFHNIVHFGIGAFLVVMSLQKNVAAQEGAVMGVGLFYVVAFVIGVMASDNLTILGMRGEGEVANFFHLISGVPLLLVGLLSSSATSAQMKRQGLA